MNQKLNRKEGNIRRRRPGKIQLVDVEEIENTGKTAQRKHKSNFNALKRKRLRAEDSVNVINCVFLSLNKVKVSVLDLYLRHYQSRCIHFAGDNNLHNVAPTVYDAHYRYLGISKNQKVLVDINWFQISKLYFTRYRMETEKIILYKFLRLRINYYF